MFTEPLESKDMVAMTTSGDERCGTPGDFLKWADMQWTLSTRWARPGQWGDYVLVINASKYVDMQFEEGPCWRESKIHVYPMKEVNYHRECMEHCPKVGAGRSPPVRTLQEWLTLSREVQAVTQDMAQLPMKMWLAATEGNLGEQPGRLR